MDGFHSGEDYRVVQTLHYTKHIHEVSLSHVLFHENDKYRIVQSLDHKKPIHSISVLLFPLL